MSPTAGAAPRTAAGLLVFVLASLVGTGAVVTASPGAVLLAPTVPLAFLLIVIGEQLTVRVSGRLIAPVTTAAALGLVLSPIARDGEMLTTSTVVALVWVAMLVGALLAKVRGGPVVEGSMAARFLGLATTAVLAHAVPFGGSTIVDPGFAQDRHRIGTAVALLAVAATGGLVERLLEAVTAWWDERQPWRAVLAAESGVVAALSVATISSGPLIAMAYLEIGWLGLPLFLLPIGAVLYTVRRVAAIRLAQSQALEALSRLGETAGVSPPGHTHRVAQISTRVARELQLDEAAVRRVRRAALLHDVGLLGLPGEPLGGTVATLPEEDEQRVAAAEQRILRESGVLGDVVPIVEQVRTPFRRYRELGEAIPLASRIVRVASAWDDVTEGATSPRAREVALERMHLGLGYEYDPEVVDALAATLASRR